MLFLFPPFIRSRYSTRPSQAHIVSTYFLKSLDQLIVLYLDILLSSQQLYPSIPNGTSQSIFHVSNSQRLQDLEETLEHIELEC